MLGIFSSRKKKDCVKVASQELYLELRSQVLALDPKKLGLSPSSGSQNLWGMMMETAIEEGAYILVALADGTVSLYLSSGGGVIGAGEHDGPRVTGAELIAHAPQYLHLARLAREFTPPGPGLTTLFFLTWEGVFTATAVEDDLGNGRSPLSPLFHKAHAIIAQIRLLDKSRSDQSFPGAELLYAATQGDLPGVEQCLAAGIPVDSSDTTGLTPAMAAAHHGHEAVLKRLLAAGCAVDMKDHEGYTALMFACNAGRLACVRQLLAHGADANSKDNNGSTPLMFAAQHGTNDIVRELLKVGADPRVEGTHGLSAIGFAEQNGHIETIEILREA